MATSAKIANLGVDLYKITVKDGGSIDFFTGGGGVNIDGDLTVTGDFTQRSTNDLVIEDNLITLNNGETGNGISETTSGIVIDRGVAAGGDARILFDESLQWYNSDIIDRENPFSSVGAFVLKTTNSDAAGETGSLSGLFTNFIGTFDDRDLILLDATVGNPTDSALVRVPDYYETRLWDYAGNGALIPEDGVVTGQPLRSTNFDRQSVVNVQGMIDYITAYNSYNFQDRIVSPTPNGDTRVVASDFDESGVASKVTIVVDATEVVRFTGIKTQFVNLEIEDNIIRSRSTNSDLILSGDDSGSVKLLTPMELPKYVDPIPGETDPDAPTDGIKVYSKEEADGGTGLFFVNENGTRDEIISRNKALLYSIIF